jgi:hypothetical protein
VLDAAGRGHGAGDVDDRSDRIQRNRGPDARDVVHAVLQADDQRVVADVPRELARGLVGVQALDTEEHQIRVGRRGDIS